MHSHYLDRRAPALLEATEAKGDADDLLDTRALADWFGVSANWVDLGRIRAYGPPFIKIHSRCVRYRRIDVLMWLRERTRAPVVSRRSKAETPETATVT